MGSGRVRGTRHWSDYGIVEAMRIAYLSYSSGEFDGRTLRMARSAIAAGHEVTVYARWQAGLPLVEERDGYRLIRAPWDWRMAIPGLRGRARQRARAAAARMPRGLPQPRSRDLRSRLRRGPTTMAWIGLRLMPARVQRWIRVVILFPLRPLGWARALEDIAQPADIWHGMWAGSLPALERLSARHGGRTIYDSRDVYMHSRDFSRTGGPLKRWISRLERDWAHGVDHVMTVSDAYADLLVAGLGISRPSVVRTCPPIWEPPTPRPDLVRSRLGLAPSTAVVMYQGQLALERGIEQSMAAILEVPDAVLVLLGFGALQESLERQVAAAPWKGRVFVLPPVAPDDLLAWTASADVSVMAIQGTTENHRYTTPQKLFESIAAGVPVVASDLPGMAGIIAGTPIGVLCDPASSASIAGAIRAILDEAPAARAARREAVLRIARDQYNWEAQVETLFAVYASLEPVSAGSGGSRS